MKQKFSLVILEMIIIFEGLENDFLGKIAKLDAVLINHIYENDLRFLRTVFPDNWNSLDRKLAYPYE